MVSKSRHPTYILNRYIWELLKLNTTMTEMDYADPEKAPNGRSPIIPAAQEPEFDLLDKPFLVYGYSEDSTALDYTYCSGSLSYSVWSTNIGTINLILNVIKTAMETRDEAARAVNNWSSKAKYASDLGIRFSDLSVGYLEGASPEDSEGGRQAGIITIRYQYFADYDVVLPV